MEHPPASSLELRSTISADGMLALHLVDVPIPAPGPDDVVVRVEAAPINPSDLGLLLGPADITTMRAGGTPEHPATTARVPSERMAGIAGRVGQSMPVGNEGAGTIVDAGENARRLIGKTVSTRAGGMYARYRVVNTASCIVLPDGATAREGASAFVNPLTALGLVETMRREGHTALVHTAAASNLGQMLVRLCNADGIALVNIVRSADQVTLLRRLGAAYVVDSSRPTFAGDLVHVLAESGATIAFDAIGGGTLAGTILTAMERVASRDAAQYSRYGSPVHKQVYLYGSLDPSPTVLDRSFGMAWGIGGWLVTAFLEKLSPSEVQRLFARVGAELTTTFASAYTAEISLTQALAPDTIAAYAKRATGAKFLIAPQA